MKTMLQFCREFENNYPNEKNFNLYTSNQSFNFEKPIHLMAHKLLDANCFLSFILKKILKNQVCLHPKKLLK